jgi:hypothetical protein
MHFGTLLGSKTVEFETKNQVSNDKLAVKQVRLNDLRDKARSDLFFAFRLSDLTKEIITRSAPRLVSSLPLSAVRYLK